MISGGNVNKLDVYGTGTGQQSVAVKKIFNIRHVQHANYLLHEVDLYWCLVPRALLFETIEEGPLLAKSDG